MEDIQKIVSRLKEKNIGVLITDHNVHETLSITDRSYLLFEGSILMSGTSRELAEDPHVQKDLPRGEFRTPLTCQRNCFWKTSDSRK